jgi:hypothetical protein
MVSEEAVLALYRLVLGREPEDQGIVAAQMQHDSLGSLLWQCVRSEEFLVRYRTAIRRAFDA